tara:strand:+ start:367 stop:597 length:231 start_codon:yes stop_codon:yes gene_type:complete
VYIKVKKRIIVRKNIKIVNKMKVITVLDYTTGKVTQYNIEKWDIDEQRIEDFIEEKHVFPSNCHWMVHEDATIYVK